FRTVGRHPLRLPDRERICERRTADTCALRRDRLHLPRLAPVVIVRSNPESIVKEIPAQAEARHRHHPIADPNRGREPTYRGGVVDVGELIGRSGYDQEVAQWCPPVTDVEDEQL